MPRHRAPRTLAYAAPATLTAAALGPVLIALTLIITTS